MSPEGRRGLGRGGVKGGKALLLVAGGARSAAHSFLAAPATEAQETKRPK